MIELPRAALMADEIAQSAEFFSFGTNDLTQTTFGIQPRRCRKLPRHLHRSAASCPAIRSCRSTARASANWCRIGVERGRKTRKKLKVGICGEHGGDPASVAFCHEIGARLCVLLAVPRADRAPRRGAGRAGQEGRGEA